MSGTELEIRQARARAEAARQRMTCTVQVLKHRVSPATIAGNAWESLRGRSEQVADDATRTAQQHPVSLSVAGAAVALFLARKPLASILGRLFRRRHDATQGQHYSLTAGYDPQSPAAPLHGLVQVHEEKAR